MWRRSTRTGASDGREGGSGWYAETQAPRRRCSVGEALDSEGKSLMKKVARAKVRGEKGARMSERDAADAAKFSASTRPLIQLVKLRHALRELFGGSSPAMTIANSETLRLAHVVLEALFIADERDDRKGIQEIESACRRVFKRAWKPTTVRDEGYEFTATSPPKLSAPEAHLRAHMFAQEAVSLDNLERALYEIIETFVRHAEHFPRTRTGSARDVAKAILTCAIRGRDPFAAALKAWGCSASAVKNAQRSVRRQK
jgi:hypothetical protein